MKAEQFIAKGDCLLYKPKGFYGLIISIKTNHEIAHCEAFVGDGKSVAARDGVGVGEYALRTDGLAYVLRPKRWFDVEAAQKRFAEEWRGQGYDWLGLLRFAWRSEISALKFNNKQFCSEFLTRWYRAGGIDPFNGDDADAIAPADFFKSVAFRKYEVVNGEVSRRSVSVPARAS